MIVYDWNGSSWVERCTLTNGAFDAIGRRVAIDGRWVVAGGLHSAYIHELSATTWGAQFVELGTTVTADGFGQPLRVLVQNRSEPERPFVSCLVASGEA